MTKRSQRLRALVTERLTAATEEIFTLVERTIAEYEEELCRSKEENQRTLQLLEENQRRLHFLEENQRRQQLLEENQRRQQLLEETQRRQQLLEKNQRTQQLVKALSPQVLLYRLDIKPPAADPADDDDGGDEVEEEAPTVKQEPTDWLPIKEEPDLWEPELTLTPDLGFSQIKPEVFLANFSWQPPINEENLETHQEKMTNSHNLLENTSQENQSKASSKGLHVRRSFSAPAADGEGPSIISCQICGKIWPTYLSLRRHMKIHVVSKLYSCPICERRFPRQDSLMCHLRLHTGKVTVECPICGKGFTRKSSLKLHMATHNNIKPFRCSVCNKRFTQKGNMKVHMRSHTRKTVMENCVQSQRSVVP